MTVELKHINQELHLVFNGDSDSVNETLPIIEDITEWKHRGGKTISFDLNNINLPYCCPLAAQIFSWAKKVNALGLNFNLSLLPNNLQEMLSLALKVENTPPKEKKILCLF